jgi:large subunit ribosomal protein L4
MSKANLYSSKGVKEQGINLPKKFSEKVNLTLLAQAIRVYEWRKHPGLSKTKSRGEVAISKIKIWRQKGTGRARHGARSAPIFVGGGVTHGPEGVKRSLSLPKKMVSKALNVALSQKAKEGKIVVVKNIASLKKTREASTLLAKIADKEKYKDGERFTFALSEDNKKAILTLRNIKNVSVVRFSDLNAYSVYFGGVIVIDREALSSKSEGKSKSEIKDKKSGKKVTQ